MAITPRQRKSGLLYFVGWLALLYLGNGLGFAQSRQQSLRRVRERAGQALSVSASGMGNFTLTVQETKLMGEISSAGKKGNWIAAKSALQGTQEMPRQSILQCCMLPFDAENIRKVLCYISNADRDATIFISRSTPRLLESSAN